MNFSEYWANAVKHGAASDSESRNLAMSAWDAALCAAQTRNFDAAGKMRSNLEITDTLSRLHTWNHPTTTQP